YFGTVLNGSPVGVTPVQLDRRSLEDPTFNIELDTLPTSGNKVRGEIRITYADSVNTQTEPVILQVALVDSVAAFSGSRQFKYVVRKLLLNNEGHQVAQTWTPGLTYQHEFEEIIDVSINENTSHYLVAFVQDKSTRKIHQSLVLPLPNKRGVRTVGVGVDPAAPEVRGILTYPKPRYN